MICLLGPVGLLPVLLGVVWGHALVDDAYILLRFVQDVAAGRGVVANVMAVPLNAPLWTAILLLAGQLSLPLHWVAAVLSGLGWGVTAVTLYALGWTTQRPLAAGLAALLFLINPAIVTTLGLPLGWVLALAALSCWRTAQTNRDKRGRVGWQTAVLTLLLLIQFEWLTALLVLLLWVRQPRADRYVSGCVVTLAGLGWGAVSWRVGLPFAPLNLGWPVVTAVTIPILAAWGSQWLARRLIVQDWVRLSYQPLAVVLLMFIGLPLALGQAAFLWQQYQLRPLARQQLEAEAARWLHQNSEEAATLAAAPRLAYLADRPLLLNGRSLDPATLPTQLPALLATPPDYIITRRTPGWTYLTQTGWFQERYQVAQQFTAAYDAGSPLTIWQRIPSLLDQTAATPIQVRSAAGIDLVSYQAAPRRITPGEAIQVQLNWHSNQAVPPYLHTVVTAVSPLDQTVWAQRDMATPRSLPPEWIAAGTIFPERFVLTTTLDIPVGAYLLTVSLYEPRRQEFVALFQNEDTNALDRLTLGYVVVPWTGTIAATAVPINATFGDQIQLLSCDCGATAVPGETLRLQLYWTALRPPDDNYVVFIHLLDKNGQYITGHDAPPMSGRYDTAAWLPGDIIPDTHPLTLPPDLAAGRYTLRAGLYRTQDGTRLPVVDEIGRAQLDQTIQLPPLQVGGQSN